MQSCRPTAPRALRIQQEASWRYGLRSCEARKQGAFQALAFRESHQMGTLQAVDTVRMWRLRSQRALLARVSGAKCRRMGAAAPGMPLADFLEQVTR